MRIWLSLLILLVFSGQLTSRSALAAAPQGEPTNLEKAVVKAKRDLANQNEEYQKVLRSLYQINKEVKRFVEERSSLDQERILTGAQMKGLEEKISKIELRLRSQKSLLVTKFSFMNKFNSEAWFQFVLKAENSAQMERNMKILGLMGKRDVQVLKDYANSARELKRQRHIYEDRIAYVNGLQNKITEMERSLREQNDLRNNLLAGIKEKQKSTLERLKRLQSSGAGGALLGEAGIFDTLLNNSFADRRGSLSHPVMGPLTQNYGLIRDNENHLILSHRGWMYASPALSPVRAVFEGQVAHIGYFPEYGNYVIIDHGDHFYTVYGMLDGVKVRIGETLREGQDFARAGSNPFDGKSGLYFEIRHFAETLDPKPWMKGRVYEISQIKSFEDLQQ